MKQAAILPLPKFTAPLTPIFNKPVNKHHRFLGTRTRMTKKDTKYPPWNQQKKVCPWKMIGNFCCGKMWIFFMHRKTNHGFLKGKVNQMDNVESCKGNWLGWVPNHWLGFLLGSFNYRWNSVSHYVKPTRLVVLYQISKELLVWTLGWTLAFFREGKRFSSHHHSRHTRWEQVAFLMDVGLQLA